jgi:hypothetical protein
LAGTRGGSCPLSYTTKPELMRTVPFRRAVAWQSILPAIVLVVRLSAVGAQSPASPAVELVRRTVRNEMNPGNNDAKYMFRDRKQTGQGSQTKLVIETHDAMVGILVAINDRPLSAQQREEENARVDRFAKDPDELKKRQRQEREETDRVERIMKALPDAFLFEYDGSEPGSPGVGKAGHLLARLKFRPNPAYDPPSKVELVLTGMAGTMLIDTNEDRIARIDGTLQSEVSFGWGILGRLDRGGHFLVQQADAGDGHWEISRMDLGFTGKILLFKSLNIVQTEVMNDFQPVPSNLTFAQGLELLRKHEALLAENESNHSPAAAK